MQHLLCKLPTISKQRGFTLIEIIIVIAILGILSGGISLLLNQGFSAYFNSRNMSDGSWEVNAALERFSRDVGAAFSFTTITSTQLSFTDVNNNTIVYSLSGTNFRRQLNGGTAQTLASSISGLTFNYFTSALATTSSTANVYYVNCTLTFTRGGGSASMRTTVQPRNLNH